MKVHCSALQLGVVTVCFLVAVPTFAASPGLPFTEDFADTTLRDDAKTTAHWDTTEQALVLPARQPQYGAFPSSMLGADILAQNEYARDIALGDIDGDGDLDLAVANDAGTNDRYYLNDGAGNPWDSATSGDIGTDGGNSTSIALGDVDNDGDLDVVVGRNPANANRLFLNKGDSPWTGFETGLDITSDAHNTYDVALGDLDGDGDLDCVSSNGAVPIRLYLNNNGSPNPWNGVSGSDVGASANVEEVILADISGDGLLDIVGADYSTTNKAYINNGTAAPFSGVNATTVTTDNHASFSVKAGDMNGDGHLDLVVGNNDGQANRLYLNNGTGTSWTGSNITTDAHITQDIALADIDSDGDLDAVAVNYAQTNRLYLNNGSATPFVGVAGTDVSSDTHQSRSVVFGDLDGDGDADLVVGNPGQRLRYYENEAGGNPWNGVSGTTIGGSVIKIRSVFTCDIDGDGDEDVLIGSTSDEVAWYQNLDGFGTYGTKQRIDAVATWYSIAADLDTDGDFDVIVGKSVGNVLGWYENTDGTGNFGAFQMIATDIGSRVHIAPADIDSDGDLDLVTSDQALGKVRWFRNDGGGTFGINPDIAFDSNGFMDVRVADLDNDGDEDVLGITVANKVAWYENTDGLGAFSGEQIISTAINVGESVFTGDIDGDGDADVLSASAGDGKVAWYENTDGMGTFGPQSVIHSDPGDETYSVIAADADGDGDLDVLTAEFGAGQVSYYENLDGKGSFGSQLIIAASLNQANSLFVADIDGDGDLDAVAAGEISSTTWYANQAADNGGLHPFHAQAVHGSNVNQTDDDTAGVTSADMNKDGFIDLLVARVGETNLLYLNNGNDNPWNGVTPLPITADVHDTVALLTGDLDHDGDIDVVAVNAGSAPNRVYLSDDQGDPFDTVTGEDITADTNDARSGVLGDFNGDGDLDFAAGNDGINRLYLNDGSGSPWDTVSGVNITTDAHGTYALAAGDVDDDGDLDVVAGNPSSEERNRLYLNDGNGSPFDTVSGLDITTDTYETRAVLLGDVDNDGDLDLVACNGSNTAQVNRLYLNDGNGNPWDTVSGVNVTSDAHTTYAGTLVDMDTDGDLDFIAGNNGNALNRIYLNNGTATLWNGVAGASITSDAHNTTGIAAADFNHDGWLEIVSGNDGQRERYYERRVFQAGAPAFATSLEVTDTEINISAISFEAVISMPPHTAIDFWLSNNGGGKWFLAPPNANFTFSSPGSDLRWRADLHSLSPIYSPRVESVSLSLNAPEITPPVPNVVTEQNVLVQYDLTPHETDAEDSGASLNWSISPDDTSLYSASIDANDVLTVTPKLNQTGEVVATLTLTDSDLLTDTQDITISVDTTGPTPPTVVVILPTSPIEIDDLLAVLSGGTVGGGLTKQYEYEWSNGVTTIVHGPTTSIVDTLAAANTAAGETWSCRARTFDGTDYSSYSNTLMVGPIGGLSATTLSLSATPATVTLGQVVTLGGGIVPTVQGASVFFDGTQTPAGGTNTKPPTLVTNFFGNFSYIFLPDEAGPWSFNAEWFGNASLLGDSGVAGVTVNKAQPSVSLSLSATSAPVGFDELTATATLSSALPAELQGLLSGRDIRLFLRKPDASTLGPVTVQTNASGVATITPADFTAAGIAFTDPGTWQFLAEFPGDSNLKQATSTGYDQPGSARLTIKDGAGYAIVVVGKLDQNGEGEAEHARTASYVYGVLRDRGFSDEDIYYMSGVAPGGKAATPVVDDATPSQADLQNTIATWARNKMNAAPGPLYLVLLDHGSTNKFFLYSGVYNETRIVTPLELDGYLDTLQSTLTGEAATEDIVVVYGACYSGSYIDRLSGAHRTIVTSASSNEISHRGPLQSGGVRDGEPFITEFFRGLREGKTLKASFEDASTRTGEYTASSTNGPLASLFPQRPRLDDNGDGLGTIAPHLSFSGGFDGSRAHELVLGFGVNASLPVGWIEAAQTLVKGPGETIDLFARASEQPSTGHTVWMEVKPPDYAGAVPASVASGPEENYAEFQQVIPLDQTDAGNTDPGDGRYEWNGVEDLFTEPGTYKVYYFIEDGETGERATHLLTTVYRTLASNNPPEAVTLEYPADAATTSTQTYFVWSAATDPDPNPVIAYRIELATDSEFTQDLVRIDGVTHTFTQVDGLIDGETYYWRVIPFDEYGASPAANPVRTVSFDNGNPENPGAIAGTVVHACTGLPIAGALVTATNLVNTLDTAAILSDAQGAFLLQALSGDNYRLDVTASGYTAHQIATVPILSGGTTERQADLVPIGVVCEGLIGDVNLDGSINAFDATLVSIYILLAFDVDSINALLDTAGLNPFHPEFADVNRTGAVSTTDATLLNLEQLMGKGALNAYLNSKDLALTYSGEPL